MIKLRIVYWMNQKGFSQKDLSEATGISTTSINGIVSKGNVPKLESLYKIAEALDIDVRELLEPTKNQSKNDILDQIKDLADRAKD